MLDGDLLELAREPSSEKRSALLRRITDLFFDGVSERTVSETMLFDEIVLRVVRDIDVPQRADFANVVADRSRASRRLVMALARDDIAVAKAVLERSTALEDRDLVNLAIETGEEHLQAISRRRSLREIVTDVLIKRGSTVVCRILAANSGARFSMTGFATLMQQAQTDAVLQYDLAIRGDLPVDVAGELSTLLSSRLARTLKTMGLQSSDSQAPEMLARLERSLAATFDDRAREMRETAAIARDIRTGITTIDEEMRLLAKADRGFDIASVIADLIDIDHATVMTALTSPNEEPLIVMFRCLDVSWDAFETVLELRARRQNVAYTRSPALAATYSEMDRVAARRVLRFLQLRRSSRTRAA